MKKDSEINFSEEKILKYLDIFNNIFENVSIILLN